MKRCIVEERAAISLITLSITSIILILALSLLSTSLIDLNSVESNVNGVRANYLAEAAVEELLYDLSMLCDNVVRNYLFDLEYYNLTYLSEVEEENGHETYAPPVFEHYLERDIVNVLPLYNKRALDPFEEYTGSHSYEIDIKGNYHEGIIDISVIGFYNHTRKYIKMKLALPQVFDDGLDEYNLPRVKISKLRIERIQQTIEQY